MSATAYADATSVGPTICGTCWSYCRSMAVVSWSQLANCGSSTSSIRMIRSWKSWCTSCTWHAYSNGDHTCGSGRTFTSGSAISASQTLALARISWGRSGGCTVSASNPHSGHGRSRTQVQSFWSGGIGPSVVMRASSQEHRLRITLAHAGLVPQTRPHAHPASHRGRPPRRLGDLRPPRPVVRLDLRPRDARAGLLATQGRRLRDRRTPAGGRQRRRGSRLRRVVGLPAAAGVRPHARGVGLPRPGRAPAGLRPQAVRRPARRGCAPTASTWRWR